MTLMSLTTFCLTSCSKGVHHPYSDYFLEVPYKSNFKVLQLTDIHLSAKDDYDLHFKFMDLTIKEANADFIMVTGDLFTFATVSTMESLFNFLDSYKTPWGVTFGNHDEQIYFAMSYMTERLSKDYKYCKFIDYQDDDIFGYANYCINLKNGDDVKYQLYVFDSNRYYYGDYIGYDYIHEDQINWYEGMVNYSRENFGNGKVVPSLGFFHIPLEEYKTAYALYEEGSSEVIYKYGKNNEGVSNAKHNSGLFDKIVSLDSTKAIFVGHDHINNSQIEYKGVDLVYGIHSTDRIYGREDMMGGLTITIHDDNSYSIDRIYHTYEEVK